MLHGLRAMEKEVGFKQGRGTMWRSCVVMKEDLAEYEMKKHLKTKEEEHPKLLVFLSDGKIELIEIAGDGTVINVTNNSVAYALIALVACYYVDDLAFPRKYCQSLGFIQHVVIKDKYVDKKSSGFISLLWKIEGKGKGTDGDESD